MARVPSIHLIGYLINRRNNVRATKEVTEQEKRKLNEERAETEAELDHLREYLRGEVDADAEEADPDLYEREKTLALIRTLENKLESIEQALRLAEKGTYGICERCGEKIDPARLEALPHTTLCVKCKSQMERLAGMRLRPGVR
jgi:DnaK suppressor protein